ncbi:MAG: hypothetical protein OXC95_01195, partial [Dehalococcoidia bacterium]|nr:hypothetical protein [Dehalococcoidia bacterium]
MRFSELLVLLFPGVVDRLWRVYSVSDQTGEAESQLLVAPNLNGHGNPSQGSAIYADVENLGSSAQETIGRAVDHLANDPTLPRIGSLSLYVPADKSELWQIWAESEWPSVKARTRGIQHFTNGQKSKNSAELAIVADAVEDFALGKTSFIAVISNDSDFGALFVKIREMSNEGGLGQAPFLWITPSGGGPLSPEITRFIPDRFRIDLSNTPNSKVPESLPSANPGTPQNESPQISEHTPTGSLSENERITHVLIRHLPVGKFKASDAQKALKDHAPNLSVPDNQARFAK